MKTAVIYWSATGNTEAMAQNILQGLRDAGGEASLFNVSEITPEEAALYDVLLLGCPAMGSEILEEDEFEPFYTQLEGKISGKKVGLFGSYGWGDGEWMRTWQERALAAGVNVEDTLIVNQDEDGVEACLSFGARFAA